MLQQSFMSKGWLIFETHAKRCMSPISMFIFHLILHHWGSNLNPYISPVVSLSVHVAALAFAEAALQLWGQNVASRRPGPCDDGDEF